MNKESIGKNIQHYRKQRGYTQDQLAEALGITKNGIVKIENGYNLPSLENFVLICEFLNVPSDFILADTNKKFEIASYTHKWQRLTEMSNEEYEAITKSIDLFYSHLSNKN